jgi:DmsE family decaheme c-type cytochrome
MGPAGARRGREQRRRARLLALGMAWGLTTLLAATAWGQSPGLAGSESAGYVGDEVCSGCHEDAVKAYQTTIHAKVLTERNARTEAMKWGCESCHGPGQAHVEAGGGRGVGGPEFVSFEEGTAEESSAQNAVCLGCHEGGQRLYWKGSPHETRGAPCTSCHDVMKNVSVDAMLVKSNVVDTCAQCHLIRRSQLYRNAHMPLRQGALKEGWMTCTSCHNPHGTVSPALISALSTNDKCLSCHAEKRGPFLWEHAPVTENCTNCHDPHGSITANQLKMPVPRLCQTCHIATRHPSTPYAPDDRHVIARGCLNCHNNIHGSNHPSGAAFTR